MGALTAEHTHQPAGRFRFSTFLKMVDDAYIVAACWNELPNSIILLSAGLLAALRAVPDSLVASHNQRRLTASPARVSAAERLNFSLHM